MLNGRTGISGTFGEISGVVSEVAALWLQTMVALTAGDTVELRATFVARISTSPPTNVLLGAISRDWPARNG